jgi:hypothetical protein
MPSVPRDRDTIRYLQGRQRTGYTALVGRLDRIERELGAVWRELGQLVDLLEMSHACDVSTDPDDSSS